MFNIDRKKLRIIHSVAEGDICPYCKVGSVIKRKGRFSYFLACSIFPSCSFSQALAKEKKNKLDQLADDILSKY